MRAWILVGIAGAIAVGAAAYFLLVSHGASSFFPKEIQARATFPLYSLTGLPAGYNVDKESMSLSESALVFSVSYDDGAKHLNVSQQPKPISLNLDEFYTKRFVGPTTSYAGDQRIVTGSLAGVQTASVVYDTTWIIIRAPDGVGKDTLREIAGSFQKSH